MLESGITGLTVPAAVSLVVVALFSLFNGGSRQARERLREVGGPGRARATWSDLKEKVLSGLPSLGLPLLPKHEKERSRWNVRLGQAGIHHPQALPILLGAKAGLMLLGPVAGLAVFCLGLPFLWAVLVGMAGSAAGVVAPGWWVNWRAGRRRKLLRRGLRLDAMDMLVMCLEGGLSLNGALQHVKGELQAVHPELAAELSVAEREIMMGLSPGEALRKMGERTELEELRSLAAVLIQSERYGASVVKALRIHADTLRTERQHRVEELAQKAASQDPVPHAAVHLPGDLRRRPWAGGVPDQSHLYIAMT